ncbi:hypothetical protein K503DRAFT_504950 [Rhizopogon vinicolor AM-OR11-026]|uniref:Uncharacterized protein n=1 Tax=Rhizopogon vinicolor AM-OR11-026 TaxID=1314800 RepID=A0A1B7MM14_9AGAM|nr:hypothetical protein K503DRAFT_504950 [Rhizopogon vinicolor AM-OR11-026]
MQDPEEFDCVLKHSNDPITLQIQLAEFNIIPSIRAPLSIMRLTQGSLQLSALKPYCAVGELKSECHKSVSALDADVEFECRTLLAVHEAENFILLVGVEPHSVLAKYSSVVTLCTLVIKSLMSYPDSLNGDCSHLKVTRSLGVDEFRTVTGDGRLSFKLGIPMVFSVHSGVTCLISIGRYQIRVTKACATYVKHFSRRIKLKRLGAVNKPTCFITVS